MNINVNLNLDVISQIKSFYPKLFFKEIISFSDIKFPPENPNGPIEYKRTLSNCTPERGIKYATQMRWRITENKNNGLATYYIGLDDNGSIAGLSEEDMINSIHSFVYIASSIQASITYIQIICANNLSIMKIGVKIKKIKDNFLVEF